MVLAKVLGTVVATRKDESVVGHKLLLLGNLDSMGSPTGGTVVAMDAVGAGEGEIVLYATGSSARQTKVTDKRPCDAVVMAIVDSWEVGGKVIYKKGRDD